MAIIAFYGFSALAVGAALAILFTRNVMYAALCLFVTLLGISALYVLARADFLAITQMLIYVGGILVLLVFGVMLTHHAQREGSQKANIVLTTHLNRFWGAVVAVGVFVSLYWLITNTRFLITSSQVISASPISKSTLRQVGVQLMTTHVWAFEIAGILLLMALVGAAYLATDKKKSGKNLE
ncbi:MAG: NADH-quinone oxidoreductase subunit J [Spirosomataceae bacterium]